MWSPLLCWEYQMWFWNLSLRPSRWWQVVLAGSDSLVVWLDRSSLRSVVYPAIFWVGWPVLVEVGWLPCYLLYYMLSWVLVVLVCWVELGDQSSWLRLVKMFHLQIKWSIFPVRCEVIPTERWEFASVASSTSSTGGEPLRWIYSSSLLFSSLSLSPIWQLCKFPSFDLHQSLIYYVVIAISTTTICDTSVTCAHLWHWSLNIWQFCTMLEGYLP